MFVLPNLRKRNLLVHSLEQNKIVWDATKNKSFISYNLNNFRIILNNVLFMNLKINTTKYNNKQRDFFFPPKEKFYSSFCIVKINYSMVIQEMKIINTSILVDN